MLPSMLCLNAVTQNQADSNVDVTKPKTIFGVPIQPFSSPYPIQSPLFHRTTARHRQNLREHASQMAASNPGPSNPYVMVAICTASMLICVCKHLPHPVDQQTLYSSETGQQL